MNDYEEHVKAVRQAAQVLRYVVEQAIESIGNSTDTHRTNTAGLSNTQFLAGVVEQINAEIEENRAKLGILETVESQVAEILRELHE